MITPIEGAIGTAGWSIPGPHRDAFPTEGSHLERYASVFQATEINTSFYRPHKRSTYERWAASTPPGFQFAVKVPKAVTHAGLADGPDLTRFLGEIAGLGDKLGPLLIQFPPKQAFVREEATRYFEAFRRQVDGPIVCEPRHTSWFTMSANDAFRKLSIARVAADPPRAEGADDPGGWDGLAYFRLHGSPQIYRSPYGETRLEVVANQLKRAAEKGARPWCIFDNTTSYAAAADALTLLRLVGPGSDKHPHH